MRVLLPSIEYSLLGRTYADRPAGIEGRTIGFLDGWGDGEGGMYPTMAELARQLAERFDLGGTTWLRKPSISDEVPHGELVAFAARIDLVINGEGL